MENEKKWRSHDFYLSSVVLASKKLHLVKLNRLHNNFIEFEFEDPNNLASQIIKAHWDRINKVPSRDLIEAINELKTRIHNGI